MLRHLVLSLVICFSIFSSSKLSSGKTYLKDRAYAFEEQLNENTGHMDKQLSEYYLTELNLKYQDW